jgi:hypothetical protein
MRCAPTSSAGTTPPAQEPFRTVTFHGEGGTQPGVDINDNRALADVLDD